MGLDMYAFAVAAEKAGEQQVDLELGEERDEVAYWRKHHDLHGWMERLYRARGGAKEDFNCTTLRLNPEDLNKLEADVRAGNLPETTGFFFGNNSPNNETMVEDLAFIARARLVIAEGKVVFYDSWW